MKKQIKHINGTVLFECEAESLKDAVNLAIKEGANLSGAYLFGANLSGANLLGANLSRADLLGANLSRANLSRADLSRADLSGANLLGANLSRANLSGANLSGADLSGADLSRAYLFGANLSRADLSGADLSGADLSTEEIEKIRHIFQIVPEEGAFIAWKKLSGGCVAKIQIPSEAKRHNALNGRKCRAEYIKTLKIWDRDGEEIPECVGAYDNSIMYRVGELTYPDSYDPNPLVECSNGIHFFITRKEAEEWE